MSRINDAEEFWQDTSQSRHSDQNTPTTPPEENMEPEHDSLVTYPTAKLSVVVGLDEHGNEMVSELWENLATPEKPVAMFTKLGIVGMVQQTLTGQALGIIDTDYEVDDDE